MSDAHVHDAWTGQHLNFLETGADTEGAVLRVEVRLDPGGHVPRHAHLRVRERVEMLEGAVDVRIGRRSLRLEPGDALDVPKGKLHRMANPGAGPARFLMEVRPARRTETMMRLMFGVSSMLARLVRRKERR